MTLVDFDILNSLINGTVPTEVLPSDRRFVVLPQHMEMLNSIKDKERRAKLLLKFSAFQPESPHASPVSLDGGHGEKLDLFDGALFKNILDQLYVMSAKTPMRDVLLATVAIENKLIFMTSDTQLAEVVRNHGGKALAFSRC